LARPIQPGLSHTESQYSEDMDNLRNSSKMAIHDPDPDLYDPYCDPEQANNLLNLRGPDLHDSSLILTDSSKTPSKLDHTAIDMPPIYPSLNAKLQGEECACVNTGLTFKLLTGWFTQKFKYCHHLLAPHIFPYAYNKRPICLFIYFICKTQKKIF